MKFADEELRDVFGVVDLGVGAAGHAEALERVDAVEGVAEWTKDASDCLLTGGECAHAFEGYGADGTVIVHDGFVLGEAALDVGFGGGDALGQVFEEKHVKGLREDGAGDLRSLVFGDGWMNDEDLKEAGGAIGTDDVV